MKALIVIMMALVITGCSAGSSSASRKGCNDWLFGGPGPDITMVDVNNVSLKGIEEDVCNRLELYPGAKLKYEILIVDNVSEVRQFLMDTYELRYMEVKGITACYSMMYDTIVLPKRCPINVIRHEIGHAIIADYFGMPVPRWLHEQIAERAEGAR